MAERDIGCRIAAVELRKKEFRKGYEAKLRKNCDAHTYKRRPVNSMDRAVRDFNRYLVSLTLSSLLLLLYRKAIRGAYKAPRMHVAVCLHLRKHRDGSVWRLTRQANEYWNLHNFARISLIPSRYAKFFTPIFVFLLLRMKRQKIYRSRYVYYRFYVTLCHIMHESENTLSIAVIFFSCLHITVEN